MIKKRLEWLKRGLCITLAGAMIICSDTMAFAADAANGQVGFLASQRVDGKLVLPEAIKVLAQKAAG